MKWIGLTGGIATGKSTAKKLFEGLGAKTIDADLVAHAVTAIGAEGYEKVVSHFGKSFLQPDQSLDRKKLATLIFKDKIQRLKLEELLHPLIKKEVALQKGRFAQNGATLCIYDVPLLFEKNLRLEFDASVLIWCDRQQQQTRLMTRSQLTLEEAEARIQSQMRLIEKVKLADHCIDNSTDENQLALQVVNLYQTLVSVST